MLVYVGVDRFGRARVLGVPYRTLYFMAGVPQNWSVCTACVACRCLTEGEMRACVIATGRWVPPKVPQCGPRGLF